MDTIIKNITGKSETDDKIYEQAADILKGGGLVSFPTETVYGLGADALDEKASGKIYAAKGRPSDNPLIVHIADMKAVDVLARDVSSDARRLMERFWPGPLTIILKKNEIVPDSITGGLKTVAIRMPSHPVARKLIERSGIYIAAPSANISGKPSPTKGEHVIHDMDKRIDMIIVDDTVDIGVESTIVDMSEDVLTILRPGFITKKMLEEVVGEVRTDPAIAGGLDKDTVPKAPGMKYKHYAPDAELSIVEGEESRVVSKINELAKNQTDRGMKVGIMATSENASRYENGIVRIVGSRDDEADIARNLFAVLRDFDKMGVNCIYSESFSDDNVGQAVMNRLIKAAGHTIIKAV